MLYKKDFKIIAKILKDANESWRACGTPASMILSTIEDELANYLSTKNPNFDRGKFLRACDIS